MSYFTCQAWWLPCKLSILFGGCKLFNTSMCL
uniref:Uncharacterized protein n=1 Tax=Zea mays TaxID=4577 RepID=B4FJA3_MAIZE|nr:unknown [Zea mays]